MFAPALPRGGLINKEGEGVLIKGILGKFLIQRRVPLNKNGR